MITLILILGSVMGVFFTLLYFYQAVYIPIVLFSKPKDPVAKEQHRYAALISARNEEVVLGNLIKSLKDQNYPQDLLDVHVVADNCTDSTADVAREAGAFVIERFNQELKGKSYALDYLLKHIFDTKGKDYYDGFFVFDADGVLDPDFVAEMNAVFDDGFKVVTSYRNSKNYDSNWISATTGLWFMREGRFISEARTDINSSCMISGTGYLVSGEILSELGGWPYHFMTEDIQFSTVCVLQDEPIGYARKAILYDEQPVHFRDSWNQRTRWIRGFYQTFARYWKDLIKGMFRRKHRFACYDIFAFIVPASLISAGFLIILILCAIIACFMLIWDPVSAVEILAACGTSAVGLLGSLYSAIFILALITTTVEWDKIHASAGRKISTIFLLPIFVYTYFPIAIAALGHVEWKQISHTVSRDVEEVLAQGSPSTAMEKQ